MGLVTNTRTASAILALTVPLFDATIPAAVDGATAEASVAAAQLAGATRDAKSEAARAAVAVRQRRQRNRACAQGRRCFGHRLRRRQGALHAQGLASPIELIDAESTEAEARIARTNAEMAQALGVVRLLVATGQSQRLGEGESP